MKNDNGPDNQRKLEMTYRRLQIFIIVCNECFQAYFWPTLNFVGGFAIIGLLYTFILFRKELPILGVIAIFALAMMTLLLCCLMFHMGSCAILVSKNVLRRIKSWKQSNCSKHFWKSCPVIVVMMGDFHKMDRQRGPTFIRFILQRTFMLVMKTQLNVNCRG